MNTSGDELQELRRLVGELTARVFRLERALNLPSGVAAEVPRTHAPSPPSSAAEPKPAPPAMPSIPPRPASVVSGKQSSADLESRIGSHWLNRIGIAAVLIGVSYFLKFAFDNNWIGPAGRVAIGLLAGIAIVVWSEKFRHRGYVIFSYSLKAVGIGVLYLSLYAAFQVYSLIPGSVAFTMMFAVTAATALMAWTQDAEILAAFALVGGFSHASAALHWPESRSCAVHLRCPPRRRRARAGHPETVAAPVAFELRRHAAPLCRLVLQLL